jgi:hemolysin activation/secretion protein
MSAGLGRFCSPLVAGWLVAVLPASSDAQPAVASPPMATPPSATPTPAEQSRVLVRRVRIVGNTVLPEDVIDAVTAPFLGRELDFNDLEELRYRLTQAFIDRAYINSGAALPDQTVEDGVVTFRIVEGRLTGIDVVGTDWLSPGYVRNRLDPGPGSPLNLADTEQKIQLLLQDPNISKINAELVPGVAPGEARLHANVTESKMYSLSASIANDEPPNVGSVLGELNGVVRDISGWGDALNLRYGRTTGVNEGGVSWSIPVTATDTTVTIKWDYNGAGVISNQFSGLDISSTTTTYGIAVSQPIYHTPERALTLSLALDDRASDTFLLGEPFSFSPGYVDGHARATVLRLLVDWIDRQPTHVFALRSTVSHGLPIFGATNSAQQPNADFTSWLGQTQYVQAFGKTQLVLRGNWQLSTAPLFPFEQIALGGGTTIRGYPVNTLVSDNGVWFSLEGRIPILRMPVPSLAVDDAVLRVAPFFDYGSGWNTDRPTFGPSTLSSIGIGLLLDIGDNLSAQLYYGHGLRQIQGLGNSLQEDGIYFRLTKSLF